MEAGEGEGTGGWGVGVGGGGIVCMILPINNSLVTLYSFVYNRSFYRRCDLKIGQSSTKLA